MRLNALYLIGTLTISAIPLPAGAVAAQPAGAVPLQSGRQIAASAGYSRRAGQLSAAE